MPQTNSRDEQIYALDKTVRLWQPEKGFRTSIDAVLLAAACPAGEGDHVLDMGCGVGTVGFCILRRVPGVSVTGVDSNESYLELARKNIDLNEAQEQCRFVGCDIRQFRIAEPAQRFVHVVCNPPFLESGRHMRSPDDGIASARGHEEPSLSLKDWVDAGFHNLRPGGTLAMIHRADAVDRIIQALGRRFGAVEILPIQPKADVAAKRVIVRAIRDRKSPAIIHPGIVLHEADGRYTAAADKVLRDGEALNNLHAG